MRQLCILSRAVSVSTVLRAFSQHSLAFLFSSLYFRPISKNGSTASISVFSQYGSLGCLARVEAASPCVISMFIRIWPVVLEKLATRAYKATNVWMGATTRALWRFLFLESGSFLQLFAGRPLWAKQVQTNFDLGGIIFCSAPHILYFFGFSATAKTSLVAIVFSNFSLLRFRAVVEMGLESRCLIMRWKRNVPRRNKLRCENTSSILTANAHTNPSHTRASKSPTLTFKIRTPFRSNGYFFSVCNWGMFRRLTQLRYGSGTNNIVTKYCPAPVLERSSRLNLSLPGYYHDTFDFVSLCAE